MKKFLLLILSIFITTNVYGTEIIFSNNNEIQNKDMCVDTMFYTIPVEICRPISPWGKAVIKNTTIQEVYPQMRALMVDRHPLYRVLLDKLPAKNSKISIDMDKIETEDGYIAKRISTKTGIKALKGYVRYIIQPNLVNIIITTNEGVEAKIELKQEGNDVIINKNSEYLDFLVENMKWDDEGFPYEFNTKPHSIYGGRDDIWVDYIYLSDIRTKSGIVYKDVPIFFHKHPAKVVAKSTTIKELYYKLNWEQELPSMGTAVVTGECGEDKYIWSNDGNVGMISTSCETDSIYYKYFRQNGNNAECYFLAIDYAL